MDDVIVKVEPTDPDEDPHGTLACAEYVKMESKDDGTRTTVDRTDTGQSEADLYIAGLEDCSGADFPYVSLTESDYSSLFFDCDDDLSDTNDDFDVFALTGGVPVLPDQDGLIEMPQGLAVSGSKVARYNPMTKEYHCISCPMRGSASHLAEHYLGVHLNTKCFICPICSYSSSWVRGLLNHVETSHQESVDKADLVKNVPIYTEVITLLKHLKKLSNFITGMTDDGPKKYRCNVCGYETNRGDLARRHSLTHSGERPFACYVCQQKFKRVEHIKKHFLRLHTSATWDSTKVIRFNRDNSSGYKYFTTIDLPRPRKSGGGELNGDGLPAQGYLDVDDLVEASESWKRKEFDWVDDDVNDADDGGGAAKRFHADEVVETAAAANLTPSKGRPRKSARLAADAAAAAVAEKTVDKTLFAIRDDVAEKISKTKLAKSLERDGAASPPISPHVSVECTNGAGAAAPPPPPPPPVKTLKYTCPQCPFFAMDNWHLQRHIRARHVALKPFQCAFCRFRATYWDRVLVHARRKHDRLKCDRCSFYGEGEKQLLQHRNDEHWESLFRCKACEMSFRTSQQLDEHLLFDHSGTAKPVNNDSSKASRLDAQSSSYATPLPISDAAFPTSAFVGATSAFVGATTRAAAAAAAAASQRSPKMLPGAMFWKKQMCEFCSKYLASRKGLRAHKKFHCKTLKCSGSLASPTDLTNETTPDEIILNSCYDRSRLEDDGDASGDASDEAAARGGGGGEDEASDNAFQCSLCAFSCPTRAEMIAHMEVHWGMADGESDDDDDDGVDSSSDSLPEDTSGYPFGDHTSDELYRLARVALAAAAAAPVESESTSCEGATGCELDAEILKAKLKKDLFMHKGNGRKTLDELFPAPTSRDGEDDSDKDLASELSGQDVVNDSQ
ncbi:PREDICTED: uncharacterized protein LOC106821302 [Priapulus caudatus]|uniref:Uncharacterized protein LOC106821302 n=1 Tax=Priapulus caudatus TaxID=37621 RepID=A0ABM1FAS0_PRICU|nr:PREDICTED: uncharacterized protein LOC106821302 [Priapulus caudatus]